MGGGNIEFWVLMIARGAGGACFYTCTLLFTFIHFYTFTLLHFYKFYTFILLLHYFPTFPSGFVESSVNSVLLHHFYTKNIPWKI
jgi:hypothetical protein